MPQPIKEEIGIDLGHEVMRKRPDHMMMIGIISHEWACIELGIFDTFIQLCGGTGTWAVTATIFDTLESLSLRLDIVGKLIRLRAPTLSDEFETVIRPAMRRAAGERNTIIHGKWGTNDQYADDLIRIQMTGKTTRYSVGDFENIQSRIADACGLLGNFHGNLMAIIKPGENGA